MRFSEVFEMIREANEGKSMTYSEVLDEVREMLDDCRELLENPELIKEYIKAKIAEDFEKTVD